jgi:hypothetical protein
MPNVYIENAEKWKALAEVDYFTQFVRAWIAFNAWYKNSFDCRTDSEAINYIKTYSNRFRDNIQALLNSDEAEDRAFKLWIADLYRQLEKCSVYSDKEQKQQITFNQIVTERNPQKKTPFTRRSFVYTVERGPGEEKEKIIKITIRKRGDVGQPRFSYTQTSGYNLDDLCSHPDFGQLSEAQCKNLVACYEEINPKKPVCLLVQDMDASDYLKIDEIRFVNDVDLLCKGLIEILYNLRNALFHGTIVPDTQTRRVYEPAYHILHTLIQAL